MNTSDILSIIAIGLSIISMVWNAIGYFKYDKHLKKLDIEEKEIEIQKHKQSEEEKRKAVLKGEFIFQGGGKYYHFSIANGGKCEARNVVIHLPEEHIEAIDNISTINYLPSNQSLIFRVNPTYKCNNIVDVEFQWDDDFGECRQLIEHIVVPQIIKRKFD